jgi:hypothetical protein
MRFAEVFLRLGSAFVGWMIIYTYIVWLAALHAMSCGPDGDAMHRVLLGLAPFAAAMALLLRATRPIPDIHRLLSRLAIPLVLLLPFALKNIWVALKRSNLDGLAICANNAPETADLAWAPVQLITIALLATLIARVWRDTRIEKP